ncbi:MAG TPA: calcium-binding EGF-like domain-containing protein [Flavipsychrobacter sp.]|nr:calcium-binding EGF-like domain-containing protein [Flavipsychrobacter sp.]
MKLWKHTLVSAIAFLGVSSTILYTSCNDDSCKKLNCRNGGTCADDLCKCPSGYEGSQCENKIADRYIGVYYGITKVNEEPPFLDTARILLDKYPSSVSFVRVKRLDDTIRGTINPNNVIILSDSKYGGRNITISVDNATNKLTFQSVEKENSLIRSYNFTGTKFQ